MKKSKKNQKTFRKELLALRKVHGLGIQLIRKILQQTNHPKDVFRMDAEELEAINGIGPSVAGSINSFDNWNEIDQIIEQTQQVDAEIITWFDERYPELLREIYDPPILFWIKGDPQALRKAGVAIVGTRRASEYGRRQAEYFAQKLVEQNLSVVSGLAFGVDSESHKATLDSKGVTVAVLGSGIDNIYPSQHAGLARDIAKNNGAVISEYPLGAEPDAANFPKRNRIISGLTLGTLVVESGLKGGSMITAQSALEQNREVFVVPHSLENVSGVGCNHLIKRGAGKLVQNVDDILDELPLHHQKELELSEAREQKAHYKSLDLDKMSLSICQLLEDAPKHIDEIGEALGIATHQLSSKLLELEMQDCVKQKAGKNFELK